MSRNIETDTATGSAAISHSFTPPWGAAIIGAAVHFNTQPTTSEYLKFVLDAVDGAAYDATLGAADPSAGGADGDVFWQPEKPVRLSPGDKLSVTYTNTDTKTYGLIIFYDANPAE